MSKFKKRLMSGVLAATVMALTSQTSFAALTTEQRLTDYSQLVNTFERSYGPLRWKKTTIGLDWKKNVEDFRAKVIAARSDGEFYRVMAQFLASLQDAHVTATIPSNFRANLGFLCDYIEGKVLIDIIDPLRLPTMLFPFKKGDQLIAIGGVPVEKLMDEFIKVDNSGFELSRKRIAAVRLTSRREGSGLVVPKGTTTITVLPKGAAAPQTVTITWARFGTPLVELDDLSQLMSSDSLADSVPQANDFDSFQGELKKLPMFTMALPYEKVAEWQRTGVTDIGSLKPMFNLPEGSVQIPGVKTTAVTFDSNGKKIGLLRIPSYGDDKLLEDLARAVIEMEKTTDVLVIDQTNNPGGSVSLVSDITSLFADKSYTDMVFEIRPSLQWLSTAQGINQEIADMLKADPNSAVGNALKARFAYMEDEMRESLAARKFATTPMSLNLMGQFGMIQPQPKIHYSKPILMLINEFDFSGGDAFPAIMKDNGRVTLFGQRTTGAGGNVRGYGPLANSFFKFTVTESLMVRPNGKYMENLGISPDIVYDITEDDFNNGYRNYVKAFTAEALKLIGVTAQ